MARHSGSGPAPVNSSPESSLRERLEYWLRLLISPRAYFVAAFFGGLLLLTYYASIRFLPDLELSSTLWVLVCAFLMGAVILAVFGGALTVPGVLWCTSLASEGHPTQSDAARNKHLARSFVLELLLPLWMLVVVPFAIYRLLQVSAQSYWVQLLCIVGPLLIWPTGPAVWILFTRRKKDSRSSRFAAAFSFWQVGFWSWLAWMISLLFVGGAIASRPGASEWQLLFSAGCAYVWIGFANLCVVLLAKQTSEAGAVNRMGVESGIGIACCLLILVFLAPSYVPRLVVGVLGLGAIGNATVLMDERAKVVLAEARRNHCGHAEDGPNSLSGVTLLNVLGRQVLLECLDKNETYRFTAQKELILSWSTRQTPR